MARILLIDDNEMVRALLATFLERAGHRVHQASDGREGMKKHLLEPPDLIITDIVMPNQDGVGLIMSLRAAGSDVPIIAISGGLSNSELYLSLARRLGARRILGKPIMRSNFLQAVQEVLDERTPAAAAN